MVKLLAVMKTSAFATCPMLRNLWIRIGRGSRPEHSGFTLSELLVVVALIALLTLLFLPAMAAPRVKSESVRCLDNLRQIMNAVMLYTHDNHDFFPPNPDSAGAPLGHIWCPGNAGRGGSAEFNVDIPADPTRCLITTYLNTNASLFRCPSDARVGIYQGNDPAKIGTRVPAARSIAMNGAVGTICPGYDAGFSHSGKPTLSVNGPWLNNNHTHRRNNPWRTYGKVSETPIPGPANLWVVIEEDIYSLNDASLSVGMDTAEWIDFPATRHAMSCAIAFADGRAELHKWVDQRTKVINGNVIRKAVPGSTDWIWLTERTSVKAQ